MRNTHAKLLTAFSAGAIFVVGCSSEEQAPIFMPPDSSDVTTGGSSGTGGRAIGGRATGGRSGSTGGRSSGGVSGGGAGGANTGGANTGGAATGGVGTGGAATGGAGPDAGTGGAATGGTGGTGTGGTGTGGANTGGAGTGGAGTGGAGTGGAPVDSGTPHRRVFVTRDTYPGAFTGDAATPFAAADQLCTIAANGASLGGAWKAWLSDDSTNAIDRIADVGPWYRTGDGQLVFANKAAITSNPMVAINRDETGTVVTGVGTTHPWTGTNSDGTKAFSNCNNWGSTSGTDTSGMCGDATVATTSWTQFGALQCSIPYSLYCFEQ